MHQLSPCASGVLTCIPPRSSRSIRSRTSPRFGAIRSDSRSRQSATMTADRETPCRPRVAGGSERGSYMSATRHSIDALRSRASSAVPVAKLDCRLGRS